MTRQAKLERIARLLMGYEPGMTIAEYSNKILDSIEGNMKGKKKKQRKSC